MPVFSSTSRKGEGQTQELSGIICYHPIWYDPIWYDATLSGTTLRLGASPCRCGTPSVSLAIQMIIHGQCAKNHAGDDQGYESRGQARNEIQKETALFKRSRS